MAQAVAEAWSHLNARAIVNTVASRAGLSTTSLMMAFAFELFTVSSSSSE